MKKFLLTPRFSISIKSGATGDLATVNTDKELLVSLNKDSDKAGFAHVSSLIHDGTGTYATTITRWVDITDDLQVRVSQDDLIFEDKFIGTTLNTNKWNNPNTTMTQALAGGQLTLNNGASVTTAHNNGIVSRATFPIFTESTSYFIWTLQSNNKNLNDKLMQFGIGQYSTTSPFDVSDGAFWKYTAAGSVQAVLKTDATTQAITIDVADVPANLAETTFTIAINNNHAEFYIEENLVARIDRPAGSRSTRSTYLPMFAMVGNTATFGWPAGQLLISSASVYLADARHSYNPILRSARNGENGIQGVTGMTYTSTANIVNNTAPTLAVLSNTAASYTTLGWGFSIGAGGAVDTDYALFAYQVPNTAYGVNGINPKGLYITRIQVSTVATAAPSAAVTLQWFLGAWSTAVSLATAEAATTKWPRRLAVWGQSFLNAAAAGTQPADAIIQLASPVYVNPGEFVHIILRYVGSGGGTFTARGTATVNSFWD